MNNSLPWYDSNNFPDIQFWIWQWLTSNWQFLIVLDDWRGKETPTFQREKLICWKLTFLWGPTSSALRLCKKRPARAQLLDAGSNNNIEIICSRSKYWSLKGNVPNVRLPLGSSSLKACTLTCGSTDSSFSETSWHWSQLNCVYQLAELLVQNMKKNKAKYGYLQRSGSYLPQRTSIKSFWWMLGLTIPETMHIVKLNPAGGLWITVSTWRGEFHTRKKGSGISDLPKPEWRKASQGCMQV